ncbi:DUF3293 domain-containing protein [Deinococcus irradiatisoli]|uniref:DUF3293 domain-containing protein n=1 Tax=Deinococcus irradiatisoli TaxID=2202254 RepID=UPI001FE65A36|nr:DUF3293 domain-containing protein [Deinococcus irradiatisoli]
MTAWNPQGERQDRRRNEAAQARLRAELIGWPQREGVNGEAEWAEPSLIVLDLPLHRAAELGARFDQAAVLWGVGRRAALVWCRPLRLERCWLRRDAGRYTSLP